MHKSTHIQSDQNKQHYLSGDATPYCWQAMANTAEHSTRTQHMRHVCWMQTH